jgi:hypothetical protein
MKKILSILCLLLTTIAFADPCRDSHDVREVFGCETNEFAFERFNDSSIMMAINRDARIACDQSGLCRFSSVTSNDHRFTATFSFGEGNQSGMMGSGTNIYLPGNGGNGSGCLGGNDGNGKNSCSQPYWGITLKFTKGQCSQTVRVPRAVYYALNRYMYGLMSEEGGTRRGFTPADEAMIMFYTTVMKQATGCVAGQ